MLFADVAGSTRLFESLGDARARALISTALDLLAGAVRDHGGRVIKTIGDEVMCTFPRAAQAVQSAIDMQQRVHADPECQAQALSIRIGLHHGPVIEEDGDVYGDAVNVASRIVDRAQADQILVSAQSLVGITDVGRLRTRPLGRTHVTGRRESIDLCDVIWQQDDSHITALTRAVSLADTLRGQLNLRHLKRVCILDRDSPPLTIGREPSNDIVIDGDWVSRQHARLEHRRGMFYLIDRSTNGSWVQIGNERPLRIHRNELPLRHSGWIGIGQTLEVAGENRIAFECLDVP